MYLNQVDAGCPEARADAKSGGCWNAGISGLGSAAGAPGQNEGGKHEEMNYQEDFGYRTCVTTEYSPHVHGSDAAEPHDIGQDNGVTRR